MGEQVTLNGFTKFAGGLDTKSMYYLVLKHTCNINLISLPIEGSSTGTYSLFNQFRDNEVMFHVCTLLPYVEGDSQQVLYFIYSELLNVLILMFTFFRSSNAKDTSEMTLSSWSTWKKGLCLNPTASVPTSFMSLWLFNPTVAMQKDK